MNVTLILDGVAEKIDVREASSEKELLLQDNEDIRVQIWTHLYPVILGALIFYIFLSISWLFYNIQSYRRVQSTDRKSSVGEQSTSRVLQTNSDGERGG
ncbi:hypothetical protein M3Y94_01004500 [Aphelenchoides besseyi]|nr:hypothetical protein M3Y94_01004500 [Aphelenchoides besseyi]